MSEYGLLCDNENDSHVLWFATVKEAMTEYESSGGTLLDLNEIRSVGAYSIVKKLSKQEIKSGLIAGDEQHDGEMSERAQTPEARRVQKFRAEWDLRARIKKLL